MLTGKGEDEKASRKFHVIISSREKVLPSLSSECESVAFSVLLKFNFPRSTCNDRKSK